MFTVSNSRILKLIFRQKATWFDQFVVKEPLFIIILPSTNTSDTKKKTIRNQQECIHCRTKITCKYKYLNQELTV